jgi:hypothetical protein
MTTMRFNQLLAGPLRHPLPMFTMTRLSLALKAVVDECGEAGEKALERHCAKRQAQDETQARREEGL